MKLINSSLFILILFVLSLTADPRINITEGTITSIENTSGDSGVSKRYTRGKLPVLSEGVYRYTAHFVKNDSIKNPTLFLGAMYYPCTITQNKYVIYRWGTLDKNGGMVNYRSTALLLMEEKLEETNTIVIDFWTDGLTMGLPDLWIGSNRDVTVQTELYNALNVTGTRIGVFLSFLVFLFAMFAFILTKQHRSKIFTYAFFALMTTLTFHMFLFNGSTIDHLIQTKIFRTATLLMGLALFYMISDLTAQFKIKKLQVILFLIHVPVFYLIWTSGSKYAVEEIISKAIPMITAPILLLTFATSVRSIQKNNSPENWLILANVLIIFYATYNDLSSLGEKFLPDVWMIPYAYILMTFTGAATIIWRQVKLYNEHQKNRQELVTLYNKLEIANRDTEAARELAVQESAARESFLKTIAHELRTPLTGILGGVNAIAEDEHIPLHLKKPAFYMKSSFHRLFVTVSNLFDFVEIKRGPIPIVPHHFSVLDVIEPVLEFYKDVARSKGISLIVLPEKGIPDDLYGDSEHLLQVVDNLIGNAIKFTKTGGVSCEMGYSNSRLNITIKDTGVGISEEKQAAMFKAFSRGEDFSFAQKYEGVGLGLAIVDAVVRAMKGTLTFSSIINKGTLFSISIPLIPANNRRVVFTSKKKILVVEDNVVNSLMVVKQLESGKFAVEAVFNGQEAVDRCKENQYDAILMDIQMPIMDGLRATMEIRKFNVKIPIIALTANGDRLQCMRVGMNEVLMKPISSDKLISVVSNSIVGSEKGQ